MKYVVVTGGIISGLGKGITASSIGVLLKGCGWRVSAIKIDPYLNVDAGTMSPYEHGECYVLDDGGEVDLDLGNYERYLDVSLSRDNNITTGKIFKSVIDKERRGEFNGKTVSVVPHVTNAIQEWIERVSRTPIDNLSDPPDVCVIELGGTIGDIESMPYVEALRQMRYNVGPDNFFLAHVSLVPIVGEAKTKPTQHGVKEIRSVRHTVSALHSRVDLRSRAVAAPVAYPWYACFSPRCAFVRIRLVRMQLGLPPDLVVCRCTKPLDDALRAKLGMFCQAPFPIAPFT